nr:helix-turn-helix domain-containing protein [Paenibacillus bovis]
MKYKNETRKRQSSFEEKCRVVQEILEQGRHKKDVAEDYQIHINTINNWIRAYKAKGVNGLRSAVKGAKSDDIKTQSELDRLREIEKKYNEQMKEIEILKKFQAFLKENENKKHMKR